MEHLISDHPITSQLVSPQEIPSHYDNHIVRTLSSMAGQYLDQNSFAAMLQQNDVVLYEVYEICRPQVAGELLYGTSVVHPGKVGKEYFMTKGHFHNVLETSEVYYCLHGHGYMVMETPEGECSVEELTPKTVVYVPPRWAHRSINVGLDDLVIFFVYPGNAGHDYGTIQARGFRKLIMECDGVPVIVDNPCWSHSDHKWEE